MRHGPTSHSSSYGRTRSVRTRSGISSAAQTAWAFESAFPNPRLDSPRGHLDWQFRVTEYHRGHFEVYAVDPRTGQDAGHIYYEFRGKRVLVTILHVNGRYQHTDCLLALLAKPRAYAAQGYALAGWGLEPGSRLARLYTRYQLREAARQKAARKTRLEQRVSRFKSLGNGLLKRLRLR
jgi:hypothetical protein